MPQVRGELSDMSEFLFRRGALIQFRCHFDGKVRCRWDAIYHGEQIVHTVGKNKRDTHMIGPVTEEDKVTSIRHGYLVERFL